MKQNVYTAIQQVIDQVPIRATCFHPSGETYVVGTNSKALKICRYPNLNASLTYSVDTSHISEASQLTNNNTTYNTSNPNPIGAPEITFTCLHVHCGSVYCSAFNGAGDLLATGSNDQSVHVIKYNPSKHIPEGSEYKLPIHSGTVRDLSFMHGVNSSFVVSAGAGDNEINVTDCELMKVTQVLRGHEAAIMSIRCFNESSANTFATGSLDGTIRLWDLRSNEFVKCVTPHDDHHVDIVDDGCDIVSTSYSDNHPHEDKRLHIPSTERDSEHPDPRIIDVDARGSDDDPSLQQQEEKENGQANQGERLDQPRDQREHHHHHHQQQQQQQKNRCNSIGVIRIDPTDRLLVSGHKDGTCVLFDIRGNQVVQSFQAHEDEIRTLNFSPNAYYLLSGSYDRKVKLWDLQGHLSNKLPGVELLELDDKVVQTAWHPVDYNFVTTCAKGTATLWAIPDFETWINSQTSEMGD